MDAIDVSRLRRASSGARGVTVEVASELRVALFAGVSVSIFVGGMDNYCSWEGPFDNGRVRGAERVVERWNEWTKVG